MQIIEEARGKINFNLFVGNRRSDGYHDTDTVMHTVALCDTIRLRKAEALRLDIIVGKAPRREENLMWRAAELFFAKTGVTGSVHMELAKHVPSEAGMGGGSADGAAVLRGLNRLYETNIPQTELAAWGASLGADVPFCVIGGCARCGGRGERITPLPPWKGLPLVIVQPTVSTPTKEAYRRLDETDFPRQNTTDATVEAVRRQDRAALGRAMSNDFERLFAEEPFIGERGRDLKKYGRPCLMTGSGSAFFLIANDGEEGGRIADRWKREHPSDYVATTETK